MRNLVELGSPKFLVQLEKQNLRLLSRLMEEKPLAVCLEMLLRRPKSHSIESLCFMTIDCTLNSHKRDRTSSSVLLYQCQSLPTARRTAYNVRHSWYMKAPV